MNQGGGVAGLGWRGRGKEDDALKGRGEVVTELSLSRTVVVTEEVDFFRRCLRVIQSPIHSGNSPPKPKQGIPTRPHGGREDTATGSFGGGFSQETGISNGTPFF